MKRDALLDAIWTGNREGLVKGLAVLSEAERKALPGKELAALRTKNHGAWADGHIERLQKAFGKSILGEAMERAPEVSPHYFAVGHMIDLALVGIGSATQVAHVRPNHDLAFVQLLDDRRPRWATKWLEQALAPATSRVRTSSIPVETLDALIRSGICKKPKCDGYYQTLACDMYWLDRFEWAKGQENPRISDYLSAHSHFLEDVYSIFDVVTVHFLGDPIAQHEKRGKEHWSIAMQRLATAGHLDRGRLLQASARGLHHDFPVNILSGYIAFHKALEPTAEELAQLQHDYLGLLSSEVDRVSAFAVAQLKQVNRQGVLDDRAFLDAAPVMLAQRSKGGIQAVLTIFRGIEKRGQEHVSEMIDQLTAALYGFPGSEIEELLLVQLEKWGNYLSDQQRQRLAALHNEMAPTLRPLLASLTGASGEVEVETRDAPVTYESEVPDDLIQRIEALPSEWRTRAGLIRDDAGNWVAGCADFDRMDLCVLSDRDPVVPMASLDELFDTMAQVVEEGDSGETMERILDAISRFGFVRDDATLARLTPLAKRAEKVAYGGSLERSAAFQLADLLVAWRDGVPYTTYAEQDLESRRRNGLVAEEEPKSLRSRALDAIRHKLLGLTGRLHDFVALRFQEVAHRCLAGTTAPLLSLPTHEGGWIAPGALVSRCQALESLGIPYPCADFIQALLRLAPDGRSDALRVAMVLNDPDSRALRWALGENTKKLVVADHSAIWLAAGRAREPRGTLELLRAHTDKITGPDGIDGATYEWTFHEKETKKGFRKARRTVMAELEVEPSLPLAIPVIRPTILLHRGIHIGRSVWASRWSTMTWPLNLDPHFAKASGDTLEDLDSRNKLIFWASGALDRLLEPDEPFTEEAKRFLAFNLVTASVDTNRQAIDLAAAALGDGRLNGEELFAMIVPLVPCYWCKLNRLGESLGAVGVHSGLHGAEVIQCLEQILMHYGELPKDVHYLLTPLVQLRECYAVPMDESVRSLLDTLPGSGKAGKLAKKLLGLTVDGGESLDGILREKLEVRLGRAERWVGMNNG